MCTPDKPEMATFEVFNSKGEHGMELRMMSVPSNMTEQYYEQLKSKLERDGFARIDTILSQAELQPYAKLYDDIIEGRVDATKHRHDLGSHTDKKSAGKDKKENICQVMWPSIYLPGGRDESVLHMKIEELAQQLLGDDMVFDFDMLISKEA